MKGFPLPNIFRQSAEGMLEQAEDWLKHAQLDVEQLLSGGVLSGYFKPDVDPVKNLINAAQQVERCKITLKLDDESREQE